MPRGLHSAGGRERAYSWVFTRTCNQSLEFSPSRFHGEKRVSFESPFAKASAVCGRQPHLTRVRKVNNQHPFRRHNFFSSQGFRHSVLSIFTFFETFVCNNEMEINKIEIIDRLNRRLKISSLHLNLNCPSCPIKITHSLLKFAKRPTKKYS